MAEVLTGQRLRDRADACLDHRKPDKETLRAWIARGADQIDHLSKQVEQLKTTLDSGGSEAALMLLEEARKAAETTLDRVQGMEAATEAALNDARDAAEAVLKEALDAAGVEASLITAAAVSEAATIVDSGRETAQHHIQATNAQCQERLERALAQAERVDDGCQNLVSQANILDGLYRKRIADIRDEADALVSLVQRFDTLPLTTGDDEFESVAVVKELAAEIVDLRAWRGQDDGAWGSDLDSQTEADEPANN